MQNKNHKVIEGLGALIATIGIGIPRGLYINSKINVKSIFLISPLQFTPYIFLDTLYITTSPALLRQVHAYFSMKIFIIKVRESRGRSSGGVCVLL